MNPRRCVAWPKGGAADGLRTLDSSGVARNGRSIGAGTGSPPVRIMAFIRRSAYPSRSRFSCRRDGTTSMSWVGNDEPCTTEATSACPSERRLCALLDREHRVRRLDHGSNALGHRHVQLTTDLAHVDPAAVLDRRYPLHAGSIGRCGPGGVARSAPLQVDHGALAGLHQAMRLDAEHVVPRAGRRPHLGVLQQVGIDEHP